MRNGTFEINHKFFKLLKERSMTHSKKSQQGFALVISLMLVALITIFTVAIGSTMIESIRENRNIDLSTKAYYAAEGGLEMALGAQKRNNEAGFQKTGSMDFNRATVKWKIVGRAGCKHKDDPDTRLEDPQTCDPRTDGTYYTPRPATGTAGVDCDPIGNYSDPNHACNWNKIAYAESVAIPLYRVYDPDTDPANGLQDVDGDGLLNPAELGMTELKIKVRTPCKDGRNECSDEPSDGERYLLDEGDDPKNSDTILIWEITAECENVDTEEVENCYLGQNDVVDDITNDYKDFIYNSEIYAALINDFGSSPTLAYKTQGYTVLYIENTINRDIDYGIDNFLFWGNILDFLTNQPSNFQSDEPTDLDWDWDKRIIRRPMLSFQIIQSLVDQSGGRVPYLEFQVEMKGDGEIADIYQTFISEGFSDNFKQSLEAKRGHSTGALKFVIQN